MANIADLQKEIDDLKYEIARELNLKPIDVENLIKYLNQLMYNYEYIIKGMEDGPRDNTPS